MSLKDKIKEAKELINYSKDIYIMGHKDLDLDAIGSAIAIHNLLLEENKKSTIIIDDQFHEPAVSKVLEETKNKIIVKTSKEININKKSLLIIVDTNKSYLLQNEKLLEQTDNILIVDHHDLTKDSINSGLVLIDEKASSVCEMIAQYIFSNNLKISEYIATILLSGIVLDTNNFVIKTTANTYNIAYNLTLLGADPIKVQYLLKQDIEDYIARQKVITDVKIFNNNIAIAKGSQRIKYRREELAKIADTLLQFNHIESSYVIGYLSTKTVGISARSIGKENVGKIINKLGGGGDDHEAAAKIEESKIEEIEEKLISILNK